MVKLLVEAKMTDNIAYCGSHKFIHWPEMGVWVCDGQIIDPEGPTEVSLQVDKHSGGISKGADASPQPKQTNKHLIKFVYNGKIVNQFSMNFAERFSQTMDNSTYIYTGFLSDQIGLD